jgi:hypothetical protein
MGNAALSHKTRTLEKYTGEHCGSHKHCSPAVPARVAHGENAFPSLFLNERRGLLLLLLLSSSLVLLLLAVSYLV